MNHDQQHPRGPDFTDRSWQLKFFHALRGIGWGLSNRGETWTRNSFLVHIPATIAVLAWALMRGWSVVSVAMLVGCIALVWVAELINSSLEAMARAVTDQPNHDIRMALDIASGAVLMASAFAVVIGGLLLLQG